MPRTARLLTGLSTMLLRGLASKLIERAHAVESHLGMPNYSFKRTEVTGCATIMRLAAAAAQLKR